MIALIKPVAGFLVGFIAGRSIDSGDPFLWVPAIALFVLVCSLLLGNRLLQSRPDPLESWDMAVRADNRRTGRYY